MVVSGRLISSGLVALGVACGGVAERSGAGTRSAAGGSGGSAAGMIHSIVDPGGRSGEGSPIAAGSSSGGADGSAGEIGMDCDQGATTEYYEGGAPLELLNGFRGTFDGAALELVAASSEAGIGEPGSIYGDVGGCNGYIKTFVALSFGAPYAGDTFIIDVSRGESCEISAIYQPLDEPDVAAEIELELRSWLPEGARDTFLSVGEFSARVPAPAEHEISGKFTLEGGFWRCLL